jgi:hypothetical protein
MSTADDETSTATLKRKGIGFHFLFIIFNLALKVNVANGFDANLTLEAELLQTAIAVDTFNLLAAAGDRKVIQFRWLHPKQILKNVWFDATKTGAIVINAAFAGSFVKVNTPAISTNHTQVKRQFCGQKVVF